MKMYFGFTPWLLLLGSCSAQNWRWPAEAQASPSVRIDTKVRFVDKEPSDKKNNVQADEIPFREPTDTEGFYNRPPGHGRYPVRVDDHRAPYRVSGQGIYPVTTYRTPIDSDGTLDSLTYCKCVSTLDCNPRTDINHACGSGQYLCCYKRPNKSTIPNPEYFNEIDDETQDILPGKPGFVGAFLPPRRDYEETFGHSQEAAFISSGTNRNHNTKTDLLVGPLAPTHIRPSKKDVLVGPSGPTGLIGPPQRPVLVGPGGPTGQIGPDGPKDTSPDASAQRGVYSQGVLVGPGGPTGIIGPNRGFNRGILTGPGGPTGLIGPGYGRQNGPGLLVGPGGPTGIIGPGRPLLVGPGGPTGIIGPRYFG